MLSRPVPSVGNVIASIAASNDPASALEAMVVKSLVGNGFTRKGAREAIQYAIKIGVMKKKVVQMLIINGES